jgi:sigma-B regulation protein RsbU (phosphoserine phosphatase)
MVSIDEAKVLAPVYASVSHTIIHFLVEFTVILVVIVFVARWLTEPAKRLAEFAEKLAAGDLHAQIGKVHFAKEITQLAHTFDKMVVDLKSNIEHRIKEETARQAVEEEIKVARGIQASLLPHAFPPFPDRQEFDLFATNEPAEFIAGDFFDFFFIKPDTLAFVIADVSGHGVPAALLMAVSRTIIRSCTTPDHTPREVVSYINRVLSKDNEDTMFVTLLYGHYNVETGELTYVNAGHDPPYIVRVDGRLEALPATGPLVGAFEKVTYEERTICLQPGDLLAAFTDGVTEAQSSDDGSMYGVERLERLLCKIHTHSVVEICNRIYGDALGFAGYECQDDITLLALRRN